jgi:hypothetical protein
MKLSIEWQDTFGKWHHYQWVHNEKDAFNIASSITTKRNQRARIRDASGALFDLIDG